MKDQIALKIMRSDEESFELFFRMNHHLQCAFANKFLNDREKSKKVVQNAFTRIWEGRAEINPEDSLESYLFTTTKELCISLLKRERVMSKYDDIYRVVYLNHKESV